MFSSESQTSGVTALDKALVRGYSQMTKEVNGAKGKKKRLNLLFELHVFQIML